MCHSSTRIPHLLTFDGDFYSAMLLLPYVNGTTLHIFTGFTYSEKSTFYQHMFSSPFYARLTSCSLYFAISVPSWVKQHISQGGFRPRGTLSSLVKVCRGVEPTAQSSFHSWSFPMLFGGGAEKHFRSNSMLGTVCSPVFNAKAFLHCHRNPENQAGWESW